MINDEDDQDNLYSISIPLNNYVLPKFSHELHTLHDLRVSDEINEKEMNENQKDYSGYPEDYNKLELINIHGQFNDKFSELGIIPVEHFVIDFRSILLNEKLKNLRGYLNSGEIEFTEFDFAKLIYQINT